MVWFGNVKVESLFGSVKELKESQSSFVRSFLTCLELLFFIFWHQILHDDFRSVSGQSQVSLRSVSGQSQVSLCLLRQTDGA